ncbi:MAG: hypothetical protein V3U98_07130 [Acidobacteriota bacterium]
MEHKVVVHFKDGRLLKGLANDPDSAEGFLHLKLAGEVSNNVQVPLESLKGIFFVKSWEGNAAYVDRNDGFEERAPSQNGIYDLQRTIVGFQDGECLKGYSYKYSPEQSAVLFFPYDPFGNNYKILIVCSALSDLEIW